MAPDQLKILRISAFPDRTGAINTELRRIFGGSGSVVNLMFTNQKLEDLVDAISEQTPDAVIFQVPKTSIDPLALRTKIAPTPILRPMYESGRPYRDGPAPFIFVGLGIVDEQGAVIAVGDGELAR